MTGAVLIALALLAIALLIWGAWRPSSRWEELPPPSPRGPRKPADAFADFASSLAWGSMSLAEWRRRADESLRRSRRRRGLEVD